MPNIKSAKKRVRQAEVRRMHNKHFRATMRTTVKNVESLIASNDKEAATEAFKTAAQHIDSSVSKGLLHKNKAARDKSRLSAAVKAL